MNNPLEVRKVIWGVVLTILWMCVFLFVKDSLAIDWAGDYKNLTYIKPLLEGLGLLIIIFYHILYKSSNETNKLSWTAVLTICWLSLIIYYPFKDPGNTNAGAVGFFALIGGLAVVVLWVRFFADEIVVA